MKKEAYLKLTEETRKEFVSLFTAKAMQDFIKITKDQNEADSGTFKVVISSDDEDRQGESVNQDGLDFKNYMENPVVLWGHDYYSPPIGVCTRIYREGNKTMGEGKFAPTPFAQTIRALYDFGAVNTVSIGFIPRSFDDAGNTLTAEVLEFSFVDIPANPKATAQRGIPMAYAKTHHLNADLLKMKGLDFAIIEDFLPETKTAMSALLAQLMPDAKQYEELATTYAKAGKFAPTFEKALELSTLATKTPCKAYFEAKALNFDVDIKGAEEGADCQLDDGTPGVMAADPKNPDGALTCVPVENASQGKGKKADGSDGADESDGGKTDAANEHDVNYTEAADELDKAMEPEMEKHIGNHTKAIDEFSKAIDEYNANKKGILSDAHTELKSAVDDEHDRHETKVNKAIDEFTEKCEKSIDEFNESNKAQTNAGGNTDANGPAAGNYPDEGVQKAIEEFKDAVDDEHDRHRSEVQKAVKEHGMKMREAAPEDVDDKCKALMKAVGSEHEKHVDVMQKSIEEFKEALEDSKVDPSGKGMKAARLSKDTREKLKAAMVGMEKSMSAHKKAVAFHKSAIEDHTEALESHRGALEQAKSAHAAIKALVANGGAESPETPEDQGTEPTKTQRSDPSGVTPTLEQFLASGQLLKSQATAIGSILEKWNKLAKDSSPRSRK